MKSLKIPLFLMLCVCSLLTPPVFSKEKEEIVKYMRIKNVSLPSSLKEFRYELKRNSFDVVLVTKVYTLLLGKNAKVLNLNYREYYDLNAKFSKKNKKEFFVDFEIKDWLQRRKTKKLRVTVHKYNLFSDYRMGMYELFYGKKFVRKNREKLLQYNNQKIKKIRKQIEQREKLDATKSKKKKLSKYKEKKDGVGSKKDTSSASDNSNRNKRQKKKKKKKRYAYSKYAESARNGISRKMSRKKSNGSASAGAMSRNDSREGDANRRSKIEKEFILETSYDTSTVSSSGIIETENSIKVVGINPLLRLNHPKARSLKLDLNMRLGKSVMSEYSYGIWTDFGASLSLDPVFNTSSASVGLSVPTLQFYNLKTAGEGLELIEAHPLDLKVKWKTSFNIFSRNFDLNTWYVNSIAPAFGEGVTSMSGSGYGLRIGVQVFGTYNVNFGISSRSLELVVLGQSFNVQDSTASVGVSKMF